MNLISKLNINGTTYDIVDNNTITSINGKTGAIEASDMAAVLTAAGYKLTDTVTTDTNTAKLQVSDTTNKKINTQESTGNYIQFTAGENKFTVGDGTSSFDVGVTPSISKNVTGSAAWSAADKITLTNASSGNVIKQSSYGITTTKPSASATDTTIPTSKAVWDSIADGIAANDAMMYKGTIAGGSTGTYGALTSAASKGDVYKVSTAGKINGVAVEVGDMLICNTDSTAAATSSNYSTIAANWDVIQVNIDGAVTGPANSTNGHVAVFDGTTGKVIKDGTYTIGKSVPSNAVFTDTDTKVTHVDNHYTPEADNNSELTAAISGTAGTFATNTEYTVLTGVKAQRDAKGHVVGLTYTAQKIKDTTVANTDKTGIKLVDTVSGTKKTDTTVIKANSSTGLSIAGGTNKFSIGDGTNYIEIPVTPSITNNVTGSGTNGYLTKWNGANTITNGAALSSAVSSQTQSTKFLREDGTWAAPSYTTNTDTKPTVSYNSTTETLTFGNFVAA